MRAVLLFLSLIFLAGCDISGAKGGQKHDDLTASREIHHKLEDGRTIICVYVVGLYKAGLSCDWNEK
jgi:hypothetical protein